MGTCKCIDKSTEESAVILEETFKKEKTTQEFTTMTSEPKILLIQALTRAYLIRSQIKQDHSETIKKESTFQYLLSKEVRSILLNHLNCSLLSATKEFPTIKLPDGSIYYGETSGKNLPYGLGERYYNDGAYIQGFWKNGELNGQGLMIFNNGNYYKGEFINSKFEGHGQLRTFDRNVYEGEWVGGKQHGKGVEKWPDGSYFEGFFVNGNKNGKGKFLWNDGSSYIGDFCDNQINGNGVYKWMDGREYIGEWKNNMMHGKGKYTWPDGRSYEGEYLNDKKEGLGVFTWADGKRYEGGWKENKQHGISVIVEKNDSIEIIKKGEWVNGNRIRWL